MEIGDIIDSKYEVKDFVGQGGMGKVFKVVHLENSEELALKYCVEKDDGSIRRFAREVRILSETEHPNVIEILSSKQYSKQ